MNRSALDHPAVSDYLRALDAALLALPAEQARELREQIVEHLDDSLGADASEQRVAEVLTALGSPADLVAEALPQGTPDTGQGQTGAAVPGSTRQEARGRSRNVLRRLAGMSWRRKIALVALALLVIIPAGYGIAFGAAPALEVGSGGEAWWPLSSSAHPVTTTADGHTQWTVPVLSGQRQGMLVTVYNPSDWTQTIVGVTDWPLSLADPRVAVSLHTSGVGDVGFPPVLFAASVPIPPHQARVLRLTWTSDICLERGTGILIDNITLRVRVGLLTETENVNLGQGWELAGPSYGRWRINGKLCS
ncbi:MAG: HAAS signaling domain-containing protein [Streptosporangiaceae bacterium]